MGFRNAIVAGATLIREAIQSQNYAAGSAGWQINQDGSAEFNNVVIRGGTVVSGLALYYNGTPAAGNLIMSIAAAAGTDSFGNAYVKGVGLYGAQGQLTAKDAAGNVAKIAGNIGGGGVLAALPGLEMQLAANGGDPAAIGALDDGSHTNLSLLMTSPSPVVGGLPGTDFSQMNMVGGDSGPPQITVDAANITYNSGLNINADAEIDSYAFDAFPSWTPALLGGGSATYSTTDGWSVRIGKMRYVYGYVTVNAAGSGATLITMNLPFVPWRGSANRRQSLGGSIAGSAADGPMVATVFAGSTGATIQRLTDSSGADLTGAKLLASSILTIEGWLREV